MKFFLDTANLEEIKSALPWGIVDGVTTNPSLLAREGRPVAEQIRRICELVEGDISAPVLGNTAAEMIGEGHDLARIHENVIVKIPVTAEGIRAAATLAREGIRVNVTLCFSAAQALLAAKAGAYIVSPFVGRLDDIGQTGIELVRQISTIYKTFGYPTQILAASLRSPHPVIECALAGVHMVTLPLKTMEMLFRHPLTDRGLEQFSNDHLLAREVAAVSA